jgi:hypothetical protein
LAINGVYHTSGFGLKLQTMVGTGTELDPYDSEFWINAEKFKFTNSAQSGQTAPFTIDASGVTPQVTFNGVVSFTNVTGTSAVITTANTLVDLDSAANTAIGTAQSTADSKVLPSGVANAINTNTTTIDGGKITTGTLNAGAIGAGTINAIDITGSSITGSTLSTSLSGRRVVVDGSTGVMDAYDSSNTLIGRYGNNVASFLEDTNAQASATIRGIASGVGLAISGYTKAIESFSETPSTTQGTRAIHGRSYNYLDDHVGGFEASRMVLRNYGNNTAGASLRASYNVVYNYGDSPSGIFQGVTGTALPQDSGSGGSYYGVRGTGFTYDFYADGPGSNYGPFTGAHDGLVVTNSNYIIGDIIRDIELVASRNVSNTLFIVAESKGASECAIGVITSSEGTMIPSVLSACDSDDKEIGVLPDGYASIQFNAVGEGMLNVCGEGGDIQNGDLIVTSSTPGKGMRQSDGIVMNYTVAKARGNHTFTSTSEVKMIPCIYLCG